MKLDKTENEFKRLCDLYHINATGLSSVLDLEFLPASEPEAEESWPARLEIGRGVEGCDQCMSVNGLQPWILDLSQADLTDKERALLRELVARFNVVERWLREVEGHGGLACWLQEEREKVRP